MGDEPKREYYVCSQMRGIGNDEMRVEDFGGIAASDALRKHLGLPPPEHTPFEKSEQTVEPYILPKTFILDGVFNMSAVKIPRNRAPKLAVDFDGTVVEHQFPHIGPPLPLAFEVLKELQEAGWKLILYTCREDGGNRAHLTEAVEFCRKNGIVFRSVNEMHPEDEFRGGGKNRKVYADVYVDDRNLGGFPGWAAVRKELLGR